MDRRRPASPVYSRQWSGSSSSTRSSPAMSPAHPHSCLIPSATRISTVKRNQNFVAKAATQHLAQVMASRATDDDDDYDDLGFWFALPPHAPSSLSGNDFNNGAKALPAVSVTRPNRSLSPADDAHIFCRESQVKDEVRGGLEFIEYTYDIFGFTFKLKLSIVRFLIPMIEGLNILFFFLLFGSEVSLFFLTSYRHKLEV